jgi:antirestriction protein ArdC
MSRTKKTAIPAAKTPAAAKKARRDIVAEITTRVIESLEAGVKPWRRPWKTTGAGPMVPVIGVGVNAVTGRPYRGLNALVLLMSGWADPRFCTFKQAQGAGGQVRKGQRGIGLVKWTAKEDSRPETLAANGGKPKRVMFPSAFTVFNVEQIDWSGRADGNPPGARVGTRGAATRGAGTAGSDGFHPESLVRAVVEAHGARVVHGGDMAAFAPALDLIEMPHSRQFGSLGDYEATLAHELTHWTGHASRMDRLRPGRDEYAFEELVAELGSLFVCAAVGAESGDLDHHASYLKVWAARLKEDKNALLRAASQAQKALDYLLPEEAEEAEEAAA